jgi:RNA recognition motif-containing protein
VHFDPNFNISRLGALAGLDMCDNENDWKKFSEAAREKRGNCLFAGMSLSREFSHLPIWDKECNRTMKLYVGNLPYQASESDLENWFSEAGISIDSVNVMRDRFSGEARGFGFVEIGNDQDAMRAVSSCNGKELMGRALVINEARPLNAGGGGRGPRAGGSGRGSGRRERARF